MHRTIATAWRFSQIEAVQCGSDTEKILENVVVGLFPLVLWMEGLDIWLAKCIVS